MSWILAAALLASTPTGAPLEKMPAGQVSRDVGKLPTGTLIFSKGDCLAVRIYTKSRYTHVAAVVEQGGAMHVYDSANGSGVRRQSLAEYLGAETPGEVHVMRPNRAFTRKQREKFRTHLDEQLGRPYSVKHHLSGKRVEGLHCAEYVIEALMAAGIMQAENPAKVSPASLHEGVHKKETYVAVRTVCLVETEPPKADGWCGQTWLDTKRCTRRCYLKMRGWFCCY